jgi:hypothetical protein
LRFRHRRITRLPKGGDVVDVNSQAQRAHVRSMRASPEA